MVDTEGRELGVGKGHPLWVLPGLRTGADSVSPADSEVFLNSRTRADYEARVLAESRRATPNPPTPLLHN